MKKTAKRLLSLVLSAVLVLSLLPTALIPTAQAAGESSSSSTNEFGFSTDVPADFNASDGNHPFGSQGSDDRVNLMPVNEIGVMETDGSSNYTKILDNMSTTLFSSSPSTDKFLYVNGVAYDPTGSGRDDHVFYYGPVQGNTNIISLQDYSYEGGTAGQVYTRNLSASSGNDYAYSWMTEARPYNAEGYLPIAAGDFDGDGKETVVLLDPEYTKLYLREYTIKEGYGLDYISSYDIGNNVSYSKGTLNTIQNLDSGSDKNKKARNTPSIQLAAGDLDGDGTDELVVTVSLGDMYKEGGTWNRGSKVLVFEKSGTGWTQKSSTQFDSVGDGKVLRAAASVVGDIDGDGNNEIVTVGVGSNDHEDNDDYEFGNYYCILMTYSNGSLSQRGVCTLTRTTTSRENDTVEYMAPLSVGLVHFNGVGTTPYLFVRGEVYQYNSGIYERFGGDTSMMGSQKIVRQPIIGNFDGNNRGQEQVLFVMATGTGTPTIGCYYNSNTNGTLSLSSRTYSTRGSNAGRVALTAADADTNDGMVAKFESKTYEYVDPEVMAVLLATPYFEDLYDEYENLGATGFGKATGTETTVSSGATNRAGAYVSFEQDISVMGLVDVASVEFETAYEYEWSTSVEMSTSYDTSIEYEAGSGSNQVVMICTPVIVYHYSILDQNGNSLTPMDISVAQKPSYSIMSLEDYNEIAERLGKATIDNSSVTSVEPGQPLSYPKTEAEIDCVSGTFATTGATVTAQYSNAIVGQSIEQGESSTVTKEYSHSIDVKAGGGALGFKVGGTYGHTWSSGTSVTTTSGVTRSGSVANIPAGNKDYSLTWQFATWDITIGEGQNQYTVPVMGYLVPSAHQPPSVPVDLTATPYTTSVTLNWQSGYASAAKYEIYRYIPDDTAKQYYLVSTVDGSETSFTCEGLNPATRYYFSIRAVDENGLCSRYADPVMVTTSSEQGLPTITTQPTNQSVPVGENVIFSTVAIPAVPTGLIGYTWQSRENSRSAWKTIEGAENRTLTLSNVKEDMDGTQYRCMISEVGGGENPSFVYTNTVTLTVGKYGTTTQLSLSQTSGSADYTEKITTTNGLENVTVTINETTYTKYNNSYSHTNSGILYVYGSDTGNYCLYNETTQTPLTALGDWVVNENGDVVATRAMEQKTEKVYTSAEASESVECPVYTATVYTVANTGSAETPSYTVTSTETDVTLYEYTPSGGSTGLYRGTEDSSGRIILDASALTPTDSANSFSNAGTYYLSSSLSPVDSDISVTEIADTGDKIQGIDKDGNSVEVPVYAAYNVYTLSSDGSKIYEKDGVFYTKSESGYNATDGYHGTSGLYGVVTESGAGTTISSMVQVGSAVTREKNVYFYTSHSGESVTLTATVKTVNNTPGSGKVTFQITNTATGAVTTLTDDTDTTGEASVTWTPSVAGVYTIKAVYSGNSTMKPSTSGSATYYALESNTATSCYEILLSGELLYGDTVSPVLNMWTASSVTTPSGVTFKVYRYNSATRNYVECENWNSTSLVPGEYRVDALLNSEVVAQKVFTVTKRPITISAPALGTISVGTDPGLNGKAAYIAYKNADGTTYALEEAYRQLFTLTGVSSNPPSGNYDISVVYQNSGSATAAEFRSRYQPTFEKSILTVTAEAVTITFSAGENGTVTGYEVGDSTTTGITSSPYSISKGGTVLFVPTATATGFTVSKWTIDGTVVTQEAINAGTFGEYGTVSLTADNSLRVSGVQKNMAVKVEFSNVTHTVSFSYTSGGSVTATQGSTNLSSPSTVVEGSSVTLTAAPAEGYVVKSWSISRDGGTLAVQTNPDGTNYTGASLTLDNIDADTTVTVTFESAGTPFQVTCSAVNANGASADGLVTFTADGLDENGKAQKGSTVKLTASVQPGTAIQRWEVSTDGGTTWTPKAGSTTEYTIYSLQDDTLVRVVIQTSTATYTVNYSIEGMKEGDTSAGTLTAKTGDTTLSSGTFCIAYSSLVFTYTEPTDYEFVRWEVNGTEVTGSSSGTTHTYTISSLDADTTVKAVVRKKPQVNFNSSVTDSTSTVIGTIAVTGTVNGVTGTITTGTYVDYNTSITVTVTPDDNYVVTAINSTSVNSAKANGPQALAVENLTADRTITATLTEKPTVTFTGSLTGGGVSVSGKVNGADNQTLTTDDHVDFGSTIKVTATPADGYVVADITAAGESLLTGNRTNGEKSFTSSAFTETGAKEVTVTFLAKPVVTITNSPANGTMEIKGTKNGTSDQAITTGSYVDFNTDLTVTLIPNTGYEVGSCKANEIALSGATAAENPDGKTYSITGVQTGQTIEAEWASIPTYTLTLLAETIDDGGAHGTISANVTRNGLSDYTQSDVTNSGTFYRDSDLVIVAVPEAGYRVQSYTWTINGQSGSGENLPDLTNVQGAVSITVRFVRMNAGVTFGPTDENNVGGYISSAMGAGNTDYLPSAGSGVDLVNGATLTLGATVQPGYEVEGWYKTVGGGTAEELITGTEGAASYTYTSDGTTSAIYLSVRFRQVEYDVTRAADPAAGGTVSASITGDKARGGQTVTFTASPNPGYVVTGWTVNGEDITDSDGNPNTLVWTVPNGYLSGPAVTRYEIKALFDLDTYTVSYNQPDNGSLTATVADGATVKGNTVVTFTATPNEHYEVDKWMVNGVAQTETGNTLRVTVTAGTTVAVTFKLKQYTVTLTQPAEGGTASATQSGPVTATTDVTFTVDPDTGYELKEWLVNGVSTAATAENTLVLTLTRNTTVQPVFKKIDITINYTLSGTAGRITAKANGSTVTSGGTVSYGSSVTLTVTPTVSTDMVLRWTVNGTAVAEMTATADAPLEYTIENVAAAQTVQVELVTRPTYTVSATTEGGGTVAITGDTENTGSVTVSRNGSVTITAAENSYYQFKEWQITVGGTTTTQTGRTLTLSDIKADTTVKAVFFEAGLFKVMFEDVTATTSTVAITANVTTIHPGADEGSSVSVVGGSELVFTVTPASGYMVKEWTVNSTPVTQDNMEALGVTMEHPLANTLTIGNLTGNTKVTVEFETPASMYTIPGNGTGYTVTVDSRKPEAPGNSTQIRKNGDVAFTVTPDSSMYLTKLEINGTDCLTSTGTDSEPNKLTIQNNGDGSFTITVSNVTQDISLAAESMQFKTEKKQLDTVPTELQEKFSSPEALQEALRTVVRQNDSRATNDQMALFDIELQYTTDGGTTWIKATKAQFPAGGITVRILYSDLGSGVDNTYDFTVIHMFTTDMNGHTVGDTESITPTKDATGISFTVTSLSPFAIGWSKYTPPAGGGGGAAPAETVFIQPSENGSVSADDTCAKKGGTVTLTVTPDEGYVLRTLTVVDESGNEVELTDMGEGKYSFVMPDSAVTVEASFKCDGGELCPSRIFTDVDTGKWYHEAIDYVIEHNLMNGVGGGLFAPNGDTYRGTLLTILYRLEGEPEVDSGSVFSDVPEGAWYHDAVLWAASNSIVEGYGNGVFGAKDPITREQFAVILHRYAQYKGYDVTARGDLSAYTDGASTHSWAAVALSWANAQGIINGLGDNLIDPTGGAIRTQAAQMLFQFCKIFME